MSQKFKVTTMFSMPISEAKRRFSEMIGSNVEIEVRDDQLCFISDRLTTLQEYLDAWNQYCIIPLKGFKYRAAKDEFSEPTIECVVLSDLPIPDVKIIRKAQSLV